MRQYERAIEYHVQHLTIAQQLNDQVGVGRACWSLGNAYAALGENTQALEYANRHLKISQEIGDTVGQTTANSNIADLKNLITK